MEQDEMMSQDMAFGPENNEKKEDIFKFAEPKETAPESQPKAEVVEEAPEESESSPEEDGQKVPYKRFKAKLDEVKEYSSRINFLEEQLEEIKKSRAESKPEDLTPDEAWTKLYGDNDIAKEAYKIQVKRDNEIAERAVEQAIERISKRESEEIERLSENEARIDESLESLQEKLGKKLTGKQEEAILSIVDEFSPTGDDGKYVSLFPFDKAYEIYTLRNKASSAPRNQARQDIANLTNDKSDGEADTTGGPNRKGWHSWEDAI